MDLSTSEDDPWLFATAADSCVRLFDVRAPTPVMSFSCESALACELVSIGGVTSAFVPVSSRFPLADPLSQPSSRAAIRIKAFVPGALAPLRLSTNSAAATSTSSR